MKTCRGCPHIALDQWPQGKQAVRCLYTGNGDRFGRGRKRCARRESASGQREDAEVVQEGRALRRGRQSLSLAYGEPAPFTQGSRTPPSAALTPPLLGEARAWAGALERKENIE